jgi:hypothetical protein
MIATHQRKMILPGEEVFCPLTTISGARDRLAGHDEDDVMALIEQDKSLPWAWDISLSHALRQRVTRDFGNFPPAAEVRILTQCVVHYQRTLKPLAWPWREVLADVLRGYKKPFITGKIISLVLNCSSSHVINLVRAKILKVVPNTDWGTGPKGSPLIVTKSFEDFLAERLIVQTKEVKC